MNVVNDSRKNQGLLLYNGQTFWHQLVYCTVLSCFTKQTSVFWIMGNCLTLTDLLYKFLLHNIMDYPN